MGESFWILTVFHLTRCYCNCRAKTDRGSYNLGALAVQKEMEEKLESETHEERPAAANCCPLGFHTGWEEVLGIHTAPAVWVRDKVQEQRPVEGSHCNSELRLLQQEGDRSDQRRGSVIWM